MDGLKTLERSKSINEKRNSIDQNILNISELTLKDYETKNNELRNHIYYL
jgi:hypothetical protein